MNAERGSRLPQTGTDGRQIGERKKRKKAGEGMEHPGLDIEKEHDCRWTDASRPFCSVCGRLLGGF